uniref:F-box domain-containing protein n=1 Tax=Leersia perrieri TaxID=77586 RepID=A0A0D9XI88_9ORYZ
MRSRRMIFSYTTTLRWHGRRDWRSLPSELTEEIAGRLLRHDVSDYLRLRAACKAWRDCTDHPRNPLDSRFRPRRWILLSNPYHYAATCAPRCRFLSTTTGACLHVDLPELEGHQIEARTDVLLVLRHKASGAICLLNPLTTRPSPTRPPHRRSPCS